MARTAPNAKNPDTRGRHRLSVGIVSTSVTGSRQVSRLLAEQGVSSTRQVSLQASELSTATDGQDMRAALETLQRHQDIEIIVLISTTPAAGAIEPILAQLQSSDKPAVVCFLGTDPRLIWRAGGIPAVSLDEAAWRAAAWVRGWDQALVSSRLEERDEQLSIQASELRARLETGRTGVRGLFVSRALFQEAQQILAGTSMTTPRELLLCTGPEARLEQLHQVGQLPHLAVLLLDIDAGSLPDGDAPSGLSRLLLSWRTPPVVIAYLHSSWSDTPDPQAHRLLTEAGVILANSSAAAARLAGMVASTATD